MRSEESGPSVCTMMYPRVRNAILYLLIVLGCTWTVLHVWFWGSSGSCSDCPAARGGPVAGGIRSVMREMYAGGGDVRAHTWCHNKTAQLDTVMTNLTGAGTRADDPTLLRVLRRDVIDPPSLNLIKMSYPLFKTPQAEAVEKLTKGKVCMVLIYLRRGTYVWS